MLNMVALMGRLTDEPELRHTANGIPVVSFTLAVERRFKSGEERTADFINIVAWRQSAEFVSKYFRKGQLVAVDGSIQTRRYQDKDGNNRTAFEVVAIIVHFAEPNRVSAPARDDAGFNASPAAFSNTDSGDFAEIATDEDLPF
ncbi:MAG: single-stranded DNA-binding protein [Oscillospiraceae bacterium]|nr:single-stranded DNA-binding protein [Oscillospiraceae bacterium]